MNSTTTNRKQVFLNRPGLEISISTEFLFVISKNQKGLSEDHSRHNVVHDLVEAKAFLKKIKLAELPELIILDIPLNLDELSSFKTWLSQSWIPSIPIVYKENYLRPVEIKRLFQLNLVDDVVKDDQDTVLLREKIRFFKSLSVDALIGPKPVKVTRKENKPLYREILKRTIDIFLSASILVVLFPVLVLIAILIKLTSKGPVIYKSKRAGQGFKVFEFYKFRTMVMGAEEMIDTLHNENMYNSPKGKPSFFKVSNDPRITKIGMFLRNTSLDELPQLLNVLRGDMSLVGNRPLPLYEAATLTTPEWAERFMAPAGITGLWQISKRGKSAMSAEERISLDIAYARRRSTRRDLRILISTPLALMQKQNQ